MKLYSLTCTVAVLLLAFAPAIQAQTPCASPGAQIIAWWDAAPNPGNQVIDLVGTTDATLENGATTGVMPGFSQEAFVFDGQDDHLASVQEMDGLDGDAWSFEGWVRPARFGVFQGIFTKLDPVSERAGDCALLITPDGRVQFRYRTNASGGNNELIFQTPPVLAIGTAHHIAVSVFNGANFGIVVDGQLQNISSTTNSSGALPSGGFDRSTFVGCVLPGTLHFEGEMDELTFYDRQVFVAEYAQIAQAGNALKCKQAAPLPAGVVTWYDGENCRNHALDRVGLESASLLPSGGAAVTITEGLVGEGFDLGIGGGLNTRRPLLRTSGPFTVEMWVFRRRNAVNEVLYSELNQAGSPPGEFVLRFLGQSLQLVRGTGLGNQAEVVTGSLPIPQNVWTHVAGVFAGPGDLRLFVNGQRTDQAVSATNLTVDLNQEGGFGVGGNGLFFLRAAVDECTLYRTAVPDADIDAIYRAGRFGKESQVDPGLDCRTGSTEDLTLDVTLSQGQVLELPSLQLAGNDTFLLSMKTPAGTFALSSYGIMVQGYSANTPPVGIPGVPEFTIDFANAAFLAGGLTPTIFGLPLLNPVGAQVAIVIPPSLAGTRLRMQGFAISPLAANGAFAATDPIDMLIRSAVSGPGL